MCGIAGQARIGGAVERGVVTAMCDAQRHRGPDSRGVHTAPGIGLGIQRLRIIDLETGDQPIFSEDRSVAVVLNGEIYNFRQLRQELEARGHRFSTRADTEVIVHLYEEFGTECVKWLHGMFGLAIWDQRRRRLVLARDRLGKKPLYYSHRDGVLSFASELAALLEDQEIPRDIDFQAIDAYLAYRYVPSPLSAFRAVRKLSPAHTLEFDADGLRIEPYWTLDYGRRATFASDQEAVEALRDALRRAVGRRLIADVPLGAFLSGGIDSSAVVAAMAEVSDRPVKTFSIGFHDERLNELPLARRIAERFGTEHHEQIVEPNALEMIPKIIRHYGEPFADATAIPTFYLAETARRHVTVALNGDGGDETFGGYSRYVVQLAAARLDRLPRPLKRVIGALSLRVPPSGRIDSTRSRIRRLGATVALSPADRYIAYMTELQGLRREELYTETFREAVGHSVVSRTTYEAWHSSTATNPLDRMLDVDVRHYLADDLLTKVDIATMACSLEGRSPLLDHEFVEFAAALPPHLKVRGTEKKVGLRMALRGWVPDEILDAPKRGFQPPLASWFRNELRELAREILLDRCSRERGYFDARSIERLIRQHVEGKADNSQGIWTLLMLELWQREFADVSRTARA